MKTMITGVRPTGSITLANYIGGIKGFVEQQDKYNSLIFIADIHGLTTYIDPKEIRNNILDITAMYMACGIDTNNTALFMQSDVLEHCNLGFLMAFQCSVGELSRMTQFKSKKKTLGKSEKDMGLFIYPALMAADILLYDARIVPVGADQRQHIEKTRDLGERFNKIYGDTFILPDYQIPRIGGKIMNLQNPSEKMSKSAPKDDKGTLFMLDDIEVTRKKIMSSCTDSENKVYYDEDNKPGISNLISLLAAITNREIEEIVDEFKDSNYKEFKIAVADQVCSFIKDVQDKYYEFRNDEDKLKDILNNGAEKARNYASNKLVEVRKKVGLYI
jgi:tryptophanyl-tRNA synthetase